MNMTKDQVQLAVQAGLDYFGPDSTATIPAKLNDGIFLLKGLLAGIAAGRIGLSAATQEAQNQQVADAVKKAVKKKTPKKKTSRKK